MICLLFPWPFSRANCTRWLDCDDQQSPKDRIKPMSNYIKGRLKERSPRQDLWMALKPTNYLELLLGLSCYIQWSDQRNFVDTRLKRCQKHGFPVIFPFSQVWDKWNSFIHLHQLALSEELCLSWDSALIWPKTGHVWSPKFAVWREFRAASACLLCLDHLIIAQQVSTWHHCQIVWRLVHTAPGPLWGAQRANVAVFLDVRLHVLC